MNLAARRRIRRFVRTLIALLPLWSPVALAASAVLWTGSAPAATITAARHDVFQP
jgi:hypothetical protein